MTATAPPARRAVPPAGWRDAVRAEWTKLESVRSTWITLLVAVLLGVGLGTLIAHLSAVGYREGHLGGTTWDPVAISLAGLGIAQFAIVVLGTLVITSEYGTRTIRVSLTATPRRGRFLLSKALVFTAVALVVGEAMAFAAFLLGQAVIGSNAPQASLGGHHVLRAVIGAGLYLAVIGLLACSVGTLVRNTAAGISAMVALIFVLPAVLSALPASWSNPIGKWWPTEAGARVEDLHRAAHALPAWSGFAVLVAFTAIVLAAAWVLLERRDA